MEDYRFCPICLKEFSEYPKVCDCGFANFEKNDLQPDARSFKVYKYVKKVFNGLIPYEKADLITNECENYIYIEEIKSEKRGVEYVDFAGGVKPTCAIEGLLAMRYSTTALILNCDYAEHCFLDESCVETLFLGKDFKGFIQNNFVQSSKLKYINVASNNPYFETRDNVLIDLRTMTILAYPRAKKGEEYWVDKDIKHISSFAFDRQENLKKIYIPREFVLDFDLGNSGLQVDRY